MITPKSTGHRVQRGVVGAVVVALVGLLCALSAAPPAHAADDDTCTQTLESACIQGTLLVRQGKQKSIPIDGATVVLTTPSGDEPAR